MTPEDIGDIFQALEDDLFAMAIRNIKRHENWEEAEGFKWTQWQAEQIAGLRAYRKRTASIVNKYFDQGKEAITKFLQEAYEGSVDDAADLAAQVGRGVISPGFFGVNSKKLDIIIDEAVKNIDTKRYAAINRMNYGYTNFLRRADIFAQSGSYTIPQVIDMASKDFLSAGLNCVEYSNGHRVNIASYAEMALRTSSSEVTRQANGDVRNELGEYLVVSNVIGMTCPICQKWQGKVMIDDVYADGKPDGEHLLVSTSKEDGFMHPNCRHQLFMYIPGITEVAELPNEVETKERYQAEQKQRYYEREIRKYKRLRDGAVDPANRQRYEARVREWTAKHDQFLQEHDYLRKNPKRLAPGFTGDEKPEKQTNSEYTVDNSLLEGTKPIASLRDSSGVQNDIAFESVDQTRQQEAVSANVQTYSNAETSTDDVRIENNDKGVDSRIVPAITAEGDTKKSSYEDITESWIENVSNNEEYVSEADGVDIGGERHKVDGHDVKLNPSPHEVEVAALLSKATGKKVVLQPKVSGSLRNVPWPDYLIDGQRWDLKELYEGKSEYLLRDIVHKKKEQADNFVFDITNSVLSEDEVIRRAVSLFSHNNTRHLKTVVIIKNGTIKRVYVRT